MMICSIVVLSYVAVFLFGRICSFVAIVNIANVDNYLPRAGDNR